MSAGRKPREKKSAAVTPIAEIFPRSRNGGASLRLRLKEKRSINGDVIRVAAEPLAAQARERALEQNRAGEYLGASEEIESAVRKLGNLGKGDGAVLRIVKKLEEEKADYQKSMSVIAQKRKFYASSTISRMRDSSGRARK